jgi:hypothetical protein
MDKNLDKIKIKYNWKASLRFPPQPLLLQSQKLSL